MGARLYVYWRRLVRRAFLSLYIIVVLGIVVIGWGLDRFYQSVNNSPLAGTLDTAFFTLLERQLAELPEQKLKTQLNKITRDIGLQADLYMLNDFAHSDIQTRILAGKVVLVTKANGAQQLYHRHKGSQFVISILAPPHEQPNKYLSEGLLLVFYLGIAAVIYIWIWPLARDLRSLELQISTVGKARGNHEITLSSRSAVHNLAVEFNRMQQRINDLLSTYKEMTSAVSHELRTPLARMKFALELAETTTDSTKLEKQLVSLRTDVHDMEALVSQLLQYAGFESQSESLHFEPGDLTALVKQLFSEIRVASFKQGVADIEYTLIDEIEGEPVYCEWHLMERVLHNLLSNAQKYAVQKVVVKVVMVNGFYEIQVEDDGPGIDVSDRTRVFESFVRLQTASAPKVKGFGLGLAIVLRIMSWHEGTVRIVNGHLPGACFVLRWPKPVK